MQNVNFFIPLCLYIVLLFITITILKLFLKKETFEKILISNGFFAVCILIILVWLNTKYISTLISNQTKWDKLAEVGDSFGAINALFSGLAFAGVFFAILLQRKELETSKKELKLSREEFITNRITNVIYKQLERVDEIYKHSVVDLYEDNDEKENIIPLLNRLKEKYNKFIKTIHNNLVNNDSIIVKNLLFEHKIMLYHFISIIERSYIILNEQLNENSLSQKENFRLFKLFELNLNQEILLHFEIFNNDYYNYISKIQIKSISSNDEIVIDMYFKRIKEISNLRDEMLESFDEAKNDIKN